ncbi:uncharacterized protein LOC113499579 [Trichoplusia ni]|uniref:Uncharacterized protein LOC113499579 n=1 Tax=Trichoplusia ni TaxID=7111 RepID=A0A7E5W5H3_TRINI|nr:uncharacterized protein LOC113499579 [Trichoplusia ni]
MGVLLHITSFYILFVYTIQAARILVVVPTPTISHQSVFRPLTQELAKRGHDVTVITTDPAFPKGGAPANLTEIDVHDTSHDASIKTSFAKSSLDLIQQFKLIPEMVLSIIEVQLKDENVANLIRDKNRQFDLLILEAYCRPLLLYSHIYKVPVIQMSSAGAFRNSLKQFGVPTHPLLYTHVPSQRLNNLTMWEKVKSLYFTYTLDKIMDDMVVKEDAFLRKHFGSDFPSVTELSNNVDMLFLNVFPIFEGIRPVPPNVVFTGGLHQNPVKELPEDLKSYLDSSKNGVVYLSFGSTMDPTLLPPERIQVLVKAASQLPYDVLWKWNGDELPGRTENIKISKWLPQSDLLRHPKIKLFITQGGLQSTDEAITAGVPMIGVPLLGDQWFNVERYEYFKIGVRLDLDIITEDNFKATVHKVIGDDSYRQNIVRLRGLLHDEMQTPLERAVWWTEYVLRHGGAKHLRSPAANISWWEYLELELVLTVLGGVLAISSVFILIAFKAYMYLFATYPGKKTSPGKKKRNPLTPLRLKTMSTEQFMTKLKKQFRVGIDMGILFYSLTLYILFVNTNEAARILVVVPTPAISHQSVFRPLTQELAKRGHDVTVITTHPAFPKGGAPANLTEIDVQDVSHDTWTKPFLEKPPTNMVDQMNLLSDMMVDTVEAQLKDEKVATLLNDKSRQFDLLILEAFCRPLLLYSHIYKVPVIQMSSAGAFHDSYVQFGAPTHPFLYPIVPSERTNNLTLWEKLKELYIIHIMNNFADDITVKGEKLLKRLFGEDSPTMKELSNNVDMLFLNVFSIFYGIRPVPPNFVYIGGLHQNPDKELPAELKSYLDSSKKGVVYLSFGSSVDPTLLPPERIQVLVKAASKLPYDVLWKWNGDELPGRTENIRISKWLPQSDLLKHPKIKLFITQGGLQSTDEAITAGVPMIGVPLMADQFFNVERYEYFKIGLRLDLNVITEENFISTVNKIIGDDSYRQNIVKLRGLLRDEVQTPLERAVWWTEYVLRHGGAKHLRSPAANISWAEYLELELVLTLLGGVLVILGALLLIVVKLYKCLFSRKVAPVKSKRN